MGESSNLISHLMRTGLFKTNRDVLDYFILDDISTHDGPMGSWTLVQLLADRGVDVSSATIGRYLKDLDYAGYTVRESNQGRILTPEGKAHLKTLSEQIERAEVHDGETQALCVNEYDELFDLLKARRVLEVAVMKEAIKNATAKDIERLRLSNSDYYADLAEKVDHIEPALDFHAILAEMSGNKYFISLLKLLIYEEKQVEAGLDVLETRFQGDVYAAQHEEITNAVEKKDVDLAVRLMKEHMDEIIRTVEQQINELKKVEN
ncbi:FCD domain-containing protein [Lachnospiraceae bacterium OttesenSCG-928-J05]|nr:FCD domain-containing protein [Lachnospiraceae bacterium OttesenSCG-928-J05]